MSRTVPRLTDSVSVGTLMETFSFAADGAEEPEEAGAEEDLASAALGASGAFALGAAEESDLAEEEAAAPASIVKRSAPTGTVALSSTSVSLITPATGARTSNEILSVSIKTTTSSASTLSPLFFNQDPMTPSEIESPIGGTFTAAVVTVRNRLQSTFTSDSCHVEGALCQFQVRTRPKKNRKATNTQKTSKRGQRRGHVSQ